MAEDLVPSPHPLTPPRSDEDWLAWLRLLRSRRVGATTFHRLLAEHGSAAAALAALPEVARAAGVTEYTVCPVQVAEAELNAGRLAGAVPLAHGAPGYPAALASLADAPPILWMLGQRQVMRRRLIALVGARNASSLGTRMARRLAAGLGEAGFTVVSGLARGIDTAAHIAALETGTMAIMAGGVDVPYPAENAVLAQDIAERGLRLSEQPPGMRPVARHFPARNRIISGLSQAVLVVEAAGRSGSLITARAALEQGREVMAVPGHPFDARAAGCNMLIRDGALLVRRVEDVLEALGADTGGPKLEAGPGAELPPAAADPASPKRAGRPRQSAPVAASTPAVANAAGRLAATLHMTDPALKRDGAKTGSGLVRQARPDSPGTDATCLAAATALHDEILSRLGPSPVAEDQLIRDLALPPGRVTPELVALELDGRITRRAGGLLCRSA